VWLKFKNKFPGFLKIEIFSIQDWLMIKFRNHNLYQIRKVRAHPQSRPHCRIFEKQPEALPSVEQGMEKDQNGRRREKEEKKKYEPEASDSGFSKIHVLLEDFGISIEQKVPKKPEPRNILRMRVTQLEYNGFMSKDANTYQVRN
jgi:hypothetical protein